MHTVKTRHDLREIALRSVPMLSSGEWQFAGEGPAPVKRNHTNLLSWIPFQRSGGSPNAGEIVAKLYGKRPKRAQATYAMMRALWDAGFRAPSSFRIPEPYGFSTKPGVLFQQRVTGTTWRELLFTELSHPVEVSQRAADWLLALHGCDILLPRGTHLMVTSRMQRLARELADNLPQLRPRIENTLADINRLMPGQSELRPSHGDFHARHVLLSRDVASVIDLDSLALREPDFDAGYAVGHLLMMSWFETRDFNAGLRAAHAFLERYLRLGKLRMSRVRFHTARAIFQSAHYGVVMRNRQMGPVEPLLDLTAYYLDGTENNIDVPSDLEKSLAV